MWLVLISTKGGYKVHSAHLSEVDARAWAACKEHDGDDTAIAHIDTDTLDSILTLAQKGQQ